MRRQLPAAAVKEVTSVGSFRPGWIAEQKIHFAPVVDGIPSSPHGQDSSVSGFRAAHVPSHLAHPPDSVPAVRNEPTCSTHAFSALPMREAFDTAPDEPLIHAFRLVHAPHSLQGASEFPERQRTMWRESDCALCEFQRLRILTPLVVRERKSGEEPVVVGDSAQPLPDQHRSGGPIGSGDQPLNFVARFLLFRAHRAPAPRSCR